MGLSFTIAAGPCQRSHSQVHSHGTHDHILLSQILDPQPEGPDPHIYIPQEQSGPVIPQGTGFPFCLQLAGLQWWYSNPTLTQTIFFVLFITPRDGPHRKHSLSIVVKTCLKRCCIAMEVIQLQLVYSLLRECVY
jgi:hypothetical protein